MDKCISGRHSAAAVLAFALLASAGGASAQVVISQVYGGGGNNGAPYTHDFIELHNNGTTAVDLTGWSVQYASSAGSSWQRTNLSGSIAPGGYFLVQQAQGANPGTSLPTPDVVGTLTLSATAGKVALVNHTTALTGVCPTGNVDFVGFGTPTTTNCAEGSAPTGSLSATVAAIRGGNGCSDSNVNAADFTIATPTPRNSASPVAGCAGGGLPMLSIDDVAFEEGLGTALLRASLSQPAGPGGVNFEFVTADGSATAGEDYTALVSRTFIPEGKSDGYLTITVLNDGIAEDDEEFHVDFRDVTGAVLGNGRATVTVFDDDYSLTAINAIQGNGATSPLVGRTVHARGIVTGRKSNGFFLQTPDSDVDGDPMTSEGVFVFTRSAPPADAAVGNTVIAHGQVLEYLPSGADPGQTPLTELSATRVSLVSVPQIIWPGMLPAPIALTTTFPDPNGPLDQLERVEGMRVKIANATVVAPTGGNTNEPNASGSSNGILHVVVTGVARPFREAGIAVTDPVPGGGNPAIPRWDFNPELITVNSRGLVGSATWDFPYDTRIGSLTGPLDYGFRRYTILPDALDLPTFRKGPRSEMRGAPTFAGSVTVAGYNLERFFDNVEDPSVDEEVLTTAALERRLNKASLGIRNYLQTPDIVGLVEVENLSVLQTLANRINTDAVADGKQDPRYTAHLLEGNDVGGIDVGFLVKNADIGNGVPRVTVNSVTQLGKDTRYTEPSGASALLNDRPPLLLDAVVHYDGGREFALSVVLVHQRSLRGAETDNASGDRIRTKRQRQAEFLATQIAELQQDPERRLVVLGDFNAFEFNDGLVDAMNVVTGTPSADEATVVPGDGADLLDPDLVNLNRLDPASTSYSFVFDGNAQSLDHVLVNEQLIVDTSLMMHNHARINADFPEINRNDANSPSRLSDHDPVLLSFVPRHRADLAVTAVANTAEVRLGQPIVFTATVANRGPDSAEWPGIGFAVDAEVPDLTIAPSSTDWSCDAPQVADGRTTVACTTYHLANAGSVDFTVSTVATQSLVGTPLMLAVAAQSQSIDRDSSNDQASASIDVYAVADLAAYLIGPVPFLRSGTVGHYALLVAQLGPDVAVKPYVTLSGDAPAANVRITPPKGWQCDVADAAEGFEATCNGDTLARGSLKDFDIAIRAPARNGDGLLTVTARVGASVRDPRQGNDSARHRVRLIGRPH